MAIITKIVIVTSVVIFNVWTENFQTYNIFHRLTLGNTFATGWAYNIVNENYIKYDCCIFKLYVLKLVFVKSKE